MGYKLEPVTTKGDFTIYCQYIDNRDDIGGGSALEATVNEILDKKSEIKILFN